MREFFIFLSVICGFLLVSAIVLCGVAFASQGSISDHLLTLGTLVWRMLIAFLLSAIGVAVCDLRAQNVSGPR